MQTEHALLLLPILRPGQALKLLYEARGSTVALQACLRGLIPLKNVADKVRARSLTSGTLWLFSLFRVYHACDSLARGLHVNLCVSILLQRVFFYLVNFHTS